MALCAASLCGAQSTFRERDFQTECPLARNSDRAGRSTQAASTALTSISHRSPIPKPAPHPNRTGHTARSHEGRHCHWQGTGITASAASATRATDNSKSSGSERKTRSPASAASADSAMARVWTAEARALGPIRAFVVHVHARAGAPVGRFAGSDARPQPGLLFSCDHARPYLKLQVAATEACSCARWASWGRHYLWGKTYLLGGRHEVGEEMPQGS